MTIPTHKLRDARYAVYYCDSAGDVRDQPLASGLTYPEAVQLADQGYGLPWRPEDLGVVAYLATPNIHGGCYIITQDQPKEEEPETRDAIIYRNILDQHLCDLGLSEAQRRHVIDRGPLKAMAGREKWAVHVMLSIIIRARKEIGR